MTPPSAPRSEEVFKALTLLKPHDTDTFRKVRVGPEHDGGYVLFDDLDNVAAAYSFGIGSQVSFDHWFAEAGKPVYMFDHTIDGLPFQHLNFHFFRQGIAGADDPAQPVFTLQHHVAQCGHAGRSDLLLKVDVEGAEYDALAAAPVEVLRQFRQLALELHGLSLLGDPGFRSRFVAAMEKVNGVFTLCHVHGNNCAPVTVVDGYVVADVLELSYVRSDLVEVRPSRTVYPSPIDHANAWWLPDHLLWFYPFLPMAMSDDPQATAAVQASLSASQQTLRAYRAQLHRQRIAELEAELASLRGAEPVA